MMFVDELADEIRRVDGNHDLGAGALAEALMHFIWKIAGAAQRHSEAVSAGAYIDTQERYWRLDGDRWYVYDTSGYRLVKYVENFAAFIESDLKNV